MSKLTLKCRNLNKINEKIKKLRFTIKESLDSDGNIRDLAAYKKLQQYLEIKKELLNG